MIRQTRTQVVFCLVIAIQFVLVTSIPVFGQIEPLMKPASWSLDAELNDVQFLDADFGWAVGERGTILKTTNGGRTWEVIPYTGIERLEAVHFINSRTGWISGGVTNPGSHRSIGCLIVTEDGGETWKRLTPSGIPVLTRIRFFNDKIGWGVGLATDFHPSGIYLTKDGGRSWVSESRYAPSSWNDGMRLDSGEYILVGTKSNFAKWNGSEFRHGFFRDTKALPMQAITVDGTGKFWSCGSGGAIMRSTDGVVWGPAMPRLANLPPEATAFLDSLTHCDFKTVFSFGSSVWVAGSPGNVLFATRDGMSWNRARTPFKGRINKLYFLDEQRGWAVGSFGQIATTLDGGATWTIQRKHGDRAVVLGVFAEPEQIPFELLAKLCTNDGNLCVIALAPIASGKSRDDRELIRIKHLANLLALNGVVLLEPEVKQIGGDASAGLKPEDVAELQRQGIVPGATPQSTQHVSYRAAITTLVRTWQPGLMLTHFPGRDAKPEHQAFYSDVNEAFRDASNGQRTFELVSELGLEPWSADKLMAVDQGVSSGAVVQPSNQFGVNLGRSLRDYAMPARGVGMATFGLAPESWAMRLVNYQKNESIARRGAMDGVSTKPDEIVSREVKEQKSGNLEGIKKQAKISSTKAELLELNYNSDPEGQRWLSLVTNYIEGMDYYGAGNFLFELGVECQNRGQVLEAERAFRILAEKYSNHPFADAAFLTLAVTLTSREMAIVSQKSMESSKAPEILDVKTANAQPLEDRIRRTSFEQSEQTGETEQTAEDIAAEIDADLNKGKAEGGVLFLMDSRTTMPTGGGHLLKPIDLSGEEARIEYVKQLFNYVGQDRPSLTTKPEMQMAYVSMQRKLNPQFNANPYFEIWRENREDGWSEIGNAEISELPPVPGAEQSPKKGLAISAGAVRSNEPPVLDGKLSEPMWAKAFEGAVYLKRKSTEGAAPGTFLFSYDDEYLYWAGVAPRSSDAGSKNLESRPRDSASIESDSLELVFDLDNDFQSLFRIAANEAGEGRDRLDRSLIWNPKWYIASSQTSTTWTIECAIPWAELGLSGPPTEKGIRFGCLRSGARVESQAWGMTKGDMKFPIARLRFQ